MTEQTTPMTGDIFMSDGGDTWLWHQQRWTMLNRQRLLHEKPELLDAPVYEQLSREMIHNSYGNGEPLEDYIANLRAIAAKAPKGAPVFIAVDEEGDYEGGSYMFLRVGCERPPTKAEVTARKARNKLIEEVHEEAAAEDGKRERAEFARLKAKFEQRQG